MIKKEQEIIPKTNLIKRLIKESVITAIIILICIVFTRRYIGFVSMVVGNSMNPTLSDGDITIVSRLSYLNDTPKVGDIVIAIEPIDKDAVVKRIAGTPGDTVTYQGKEYTLKENEYFIRGDNKGKTTDSDTYGPITGDKIIGKVIWYH